MLYDMRIFTSLSVGEKTVGDSILQVGQCMEVSAASRIGLSIGRHCALPYKAKRTYRRHKHLRRPVSRERREANHVRGPVNHWRDNDHSLTELSSASGDLYSLPICGVVPYIVGSA